VSTVTGVVAISMCAELKHVHKSRREQRLWLQSHLVCQEPLDLLCELHHALVVGKQQRNVDLKRQAASSSSA
jgi:hypothetical protein